MRFEQSVDLSKQKAFEQEMSHRDQFLSQLTIASSHQHNRYGKMLVLLETDRILITLGPDYKCFLAAFICFALAGYFLASFVNQAFENTWIKALNIMIVLTQQFAYLAVALSNPGVVLAENYASQESTQDGQATKRYCLKCKIKKSRGVQHCKSCEVCVRGFDHHCPWVSKCIGESNLKRFYFFVTMTPIYIIYFMVMMLVSLTLNAAKEPGRP